MPNRNNENEQIRNAAEDASASVKSGVEAAVKGFERVTDTVLGFSGPKAEELARQSSHNIEAVSQASTVLVRGFQEVSHEVFELAQERLKKNTEALTRLEAQTFANSEAIGRLEVQTSANTTAIDRLTERLDRLTQRFEGLTSAIGSHQEALRLISQQHNEWREQMRIIQTEIRDIWQYLNNQLRNRGNGGGQN